MFLLRSMVIGIVKVLNSLYKHRAPEEGGTVRCQYTSLNYVLLSLLSQCIFYKWIYHGPYLTFVDPFYYTASTLFAQCRTSHANPHWGGCQNYFFQRAPQTLAPPLAIRLVPVVAVGYELFYKNCQHCTESRCTMPVDQIIVFECQVLTFNAIVCVNCNKQSVSAVSPNPAL
jgi:hypothetical protein